VNVFGGYVYVGDIYTSSKYLCQLFGRYRLSERYIYFVHLLNTLWRCRPDARPSAPKILTGREPSGRARQSLREPYRDLRRDELLLYFAFLIIFFYIFCTWSNPPENIGKRTYVKRNLSQQLTRRFHANHRFECGDSAQESPSWNSTGFRVAFTPAKDGRTSISKNSCLGPELRGPVGATLRGWRANDLLRRTADRRVARIKRFELSGPLRRCRGAQ